MSVRHHVRVLVVDADLSACAAIETMLAQLGYRPQAFTNPAEGLEAAGKASFQIAIVSLGLRGSAGAELIEKLKAIDNRTCVIATTSRLDLEEARGVMRRGGGDYLEKPLDADELSLSLERACASLGLVYIQEADLNRLIGQRVRHERQAQNLTLRQLSDRADLTTSQISQVELGKNAASLWALARISNALGRQMSEMFAGI